MKRRVASLAITFNRTRSFRTLSSLFLDTSWSRLSFDISLILLRKLQHLHSFLVSFPRFRSLVLTHTHGYLTAHPPLFWTFVRFLDYTSWLWLRTHPHTLHGLVSFSSLFLVLDASRPFPPISSLHTSVLLRLLFFYPSRRTYLALSYQSVLAILARLYPLRSSRRGKKDEKAKNASLLSTPETGERKRRTELKFHVVRWKSKQKLKSRERVRRSIKPEPQPPLSASHLQSLLQACTLQPSPTPSSASSPVTPFSNS